MCNFYAYVHVIQKQENFFKTIVIITVITTKNATTLTPLLHVYYYAYCGLQQGLSDSISSVLEEAYQCEKRQERKVEQEEKAETSSLPN